MINKKQIGEKIEMSLKKRMFRSNMTILFLALFSLMMIILLVLVAFEDSFERQLDSLDQKKLDGNVLETASEVERASADDFADMARTVEKLGYDAAVISKGKIQEGSRSEHMSDLAERISETDLQKWKKLRFFFTGSLQ